MNRTAIALLALLAGCATPQEMRQGQMSERHDYTSAKAPPDVAGCIARMGEERVRSMWPTATIRPGTAGGQEVQVRITDHTLFVADVIPQGAGSRVTVHRYTGVPQTSEMPALMAKEC